MMEDYVDNDLSTQCGNNSLSASLWSPSQQHEQQPPHLSQDSKGHLTTTATTSNDEYTSWILTASQKKLQREAKSQRDIRSAQSVTTMTNDVTLTDGEDKKEIQQGKYNHWNDINIIPTESPGMENQYGSRPLQKNLQMFDPLNNSKGNKNSNKDVEQPRRCHTNGGGWIPQKSATTPTRLPTPKSSYPTSFSRPRMTKHLSSLDGINTQHHQGTMITTNWLDLDSHESTVIPIVPSKQVNQLPISMISSFVEKSSTGTWDPTDFRGKANQQLVDFDPFLSQDPLDKKDAFKCMEGGETRLPCQTTTAIPKQPRPSINTRIPLPINKTSNSTLSSSSEEEEEEPTPTLYQQEIGAPSSTTAIKRSPFYKQHETYYGDRIFRRPSLLTSDIIQEQRDKERQLSRCLDVDLVSVQGELCVPECISHPEQHLDDAEQQQQQQQQQQQLHHDTHNQSSSTTSSVSSSTSPTSQPPQRRVSSLHERLQELVNDESAWNEITKSPPTTDTMEDFWLAQVGEIEPSSVKQSLPTSSSGQPKRRNRKPPTSFHATRTIPGTKNTGPSPNISPPPCLRPAMCPSTAFKLYQCQLSPFEQQEIMKYSHIFFVGNHAKNKYQATLDHPDNNYGYDDERGDYLFVPKDHLAYRYEVLETMGKGSFGQVVKAFDHKLGSVVAIKLIRNKKRFHAQALIEVKTLEDLMRWDPDDKHNNVRMTDYFYFRNHLCIVFECLSINLYDFIKKNHFQGSSMGLIRRFTIQLLNSLTILSQHHLIHCDLKPENILLEHPEKSTIKVIDFGSSCLENEKVYTYIQSRFYRAPEVILGLDYGVAIDMWSMGCILAELYTGYPLFPGENEQDQLACIMEVRGVPSQNLVNKSARRKVFFDFYGNPKIMPNSKGKKRKPGTRSLASILKCSDDKFVDFIYQCLQWDPEDRIKPEEAFKHGWIARRSQ